MATLAGLRADTVDYIRYRLGDGMVDVELDPEHYDNSIDKSVVQKLAHSLNLSKPHSRIHICYKVDAWEVWQHTKCTISIKN